jgi:uncharacterized protein with GYD domain
MPIYISRGRFTSDAVKGMLAKPENREEAVAKLFKSVGGKLIGWYLTFGHHDWLAIGECSPLQRRSLVLRPAVSMVSIGSQYHHDHSTGDPRALASRRFPPVLALEVSLPWRPAANRCGAACADPTD